MRYSGRWASSEEMEAASSGYRMLMAATRAVIWPGSNSTFTSGFTSGNSSSLTTNLTLSTSLSRHSALTRGGFDGGGWRGWWLARKALRWSAPLSRF